MLSAFSYELSAFGLAVSLAEWLVFGDLGFHLIAEACFTRDEPARLPHSILYELVKWTRARRDSIIHRQLVGQKRVCTTARGDSLPRIAEEDGMITLANTMALVGMALIRFGGRGGGGGFALLLLGLVMIALVAWTVATPYRGPGDDRQSR